MKPPKNSVAGTRLDPTLHFATLEIDGETYNLAYDFNAIAEAERMTGVNLLQGMSQLQDLTAQQLRGLLYAALRLAHPKITPDQAGHLIRFDTLASITDGLAQAYILSMPKKKEENLEAVAS